MNDSDLETQISIANKFKRAKVDSAFGVSAKKKLTTPQLHFIDNDATNLSHTSQNVFDVVF